MPTRAKQMTEKQEVIRQAERLSATASGSTGCNSPLCTETKVQKPAEMPGSAQSARVTGSLCNSGELEPNGGREMFTPDLHLSFVAGFFDAEGTFVLVRMKPKKGRTHDHIYPKAALYNNDQELLKITQKFIGGNLRFVKRAARSEKYYDSWILDFTSKDRVAKLCKQLEPYLVLKKEQAQLMLRACEASVKDRFALKEQMGKLNVKAEMFDEVRVVGVQKELSIVPQSAWAYFAGWLEGDGCFAFQPQKFGATRYWYPWVIVYSSKLKPLAYLQNIFGGNLKTRKRKENWSFEGSLRFEDQNYVRSILKGVIPFLVSKKGVAQIMLDSLDYDSKERQVFVDQARGLV